MSISGSAAPGPRAGCCIVRAGLLGHPLPVIARAVPMRLVTCSPTLPFKHRLGNAQLVGNPTKWLRFGTVISRNVAAAAPLQQWSLGVVSSKLPCDK